MVDVIAIAPNLHSGALPQRRSVLLKDVKTIDIYNQRVDQYTQAFSPKGPDADLQAFIKALPEGGEVLDLGCGPATASVYMRDAGLVPDPVDASTEMVRTANEAHNINARVSHFDDIVEVAKYDGVWANFSLLHAARSDMPTHLAALHTALKTNGLLHLGLKLGQGAERDGIGRFYTYYTQSELADLLTQAGFQIAFERQDTGVGMAGTNDPFIIIRATKI